MNEHTLTPDLETENYPLKMLKAKMNTPEINMRKENLMNFCQECIIVLDKKFQYGLETD